MCVHYDPSSVVSFRGIPRQLTTLNTVCDYCLVVAKGAAFVVIQETFVRFYDIVAKLELKKKQNC
jgi:hypothetical protein